MPRFVILRHELPPDQPRPLHWDLMLEDGGVLRTWALGGEPSAPGEFQAQALPDHRLAYLTYEGEISGGRGSVTRWDAGEYHCLETRQHYLSGELAGERLRARFELARDAAPPHFWRVSLSAEPTTSPPSAGT